MRLASPGRASSLLDLQRMHCVQLKLHLRQLSRVAHSKHLDPIPQNPQEEETS